MEGQQYLTVNPNTFDDTSTWTYRDLQKLSMVVGLKGNSSRTQLVENLQKWNRTRKDGTKTLVEAASMDEEHSTENLDMNVDGNNFAILAVQVKGSKNGKRSGKRKSMIGLGNNDSGIVSPTLLRPLSRRDNEPGTPGRSCMKRNDNDNEALSPRPLNRKPNICFSPFNGVKVIAHREEMMSDEKRVFGRVMLMEEVDEDEDCYDDYC